MTETTQGGYMTIVNLYEQHRKRKVAMCHHMPYLKALVEGIRKERGDCVVVEFGVRSAPSTVAFLAGGAQLYSYDPACRPKDRRMYDLIEAAVGPKWEFTQDSSLEVNIPVCDVLLHDSLHNADHVYDELTRHHEKVRDYLLFHDSVYLGSYGQPAYDATDKAAIGTASKPRKNIWGIRLGIDRFLIAHRDWDVYRHDPESNGMLTLKRRK